TATPSTITGQQGITEPNRNVTMLPIVGTIAAGVPITATENISGHVPVPQEMLHSTQGAFVLEVKGDSMIGEHIMPKDYVVIKPQATAENGDLVAVRLGDEATVKRIKFHDGKARLVAANPKYDPIEIDREDSSIIGKVIGLW